MPPSPINPLRTDSSKSQSRLRIHLLVNHTHTYIHTGNHIDNVIPVDWNFNQKVSPLSRRSNVPHGMRRYIFCESGIELALIRNLHINEYNYNFIYRYICFNHLRFLMGRPHRYIQYMILFRNT